MVQLPSALTSQYIADLLNAPLEGAHDVVVDNIGSLEHYNNRSVVYTTHHPIKNNVGILLATQPHAQAAATIIVKNPGKALRILVEHIGLHIRSSCHTGIHNSAIIADSAIIGDNVTIGPYAIIDADVVIGAHSVIGSHCHIMSASTLGDNCRIGNNTVIYPHVHLGHRVTIGAQCVLGDEGFGYDWDVSHWALTPQIAQLIIDNDVDIGPMSVVDRGGLENTHIGEGTKLDAHMMIGHGVRIGKNVVMAACAAIGGSSTIGDFTISGGCAQIADHIHIAPQTRLAGGCAVGRNIKTPGDYISNIPAMPVKQWRRWYKNILHTVSDTTL